MHKMECNRCCAGTYNKIHKISFGVPGLRDEIYLCSSCCKAILSDVLTEEIKEKKETLTWRSKFLGSPVG